MWPEKSLSPVAYILLVHTEPAHIHSEGAIQGHESQEAWFTGGAVFTDCLPQGRLPMARAGWEEQGQAARTEQTDCSLCSRLSWTFSEIFSFIDFNHSVTCHSADD